MVDLTLYFFWLKGVICLHMTEERVREVVRDEVHKMQRDMVREEIKAIGEEARREVNESLATGEKVLLTP